MVFPVVLFPLPVLPTNRNRNSSPEKKQTNRPVKEVPCQLCISFYNEL